MESDLLKRDERRRREVNDEADWSVYGGPHVKLGKGTILPFKLDERTHNSVTEGRR